MTLSPTPEFDFPPGRLAARQQHLLAELGRPATRGRWIRPAVVFALVAVAGVAANVALGLGIGGRIHDFVAGTPAPPAIEERLRDEATAERIVPLLEDEQIEVTGPAHGVLAIETSGGPVALWTAPTKTRDGKAPVCYLVEFVRLSEPAGRPVGDSRCIRRAAPAGGLSWARTKQEVDGRVVAVVAGVVPADVVSGVVRSYDGAESPMALEGGFFLAELRQPDANYDLLAFDDSGTMVAIAQINFFSAGIEDFRDIKPTGPARTIIETRDSLGHPLRLKLRPAEDGVVCRVEEGAAGKGMSCGPEAAYLARKGLRIGVKMTASRMSYSGTVGPEVSSLELRYEDGRVEDVPIVERYVLVAIRKSDFRQGRRPVRFVGRDDAGRVVDDHVVNPGHFDATSPIWLDQSIGP
jgi:hypothetical protein